MKLFQFLEAEKKVIWPDQQTRNLVTKFENDRKGTMLLSVKPARNLSKRGQDQDADKPWWIGTLNPDRKKTTLYTQRWNTKAFHSNTL